MDFRFRLSGGEKGQENRVRAMASKIIYIVYENRELVVEFKGNEDEDAVRSMFYTVAEISTGGLVKLLDEKGMLMRITPDMRENDPKTRYQLHVVKTEIQPQELIHKLPSLTKDLESIKSRLRNLEDTGMPHNYPDLLHKVAALQERIAGKYHLSWLGLAQVTTEPSFKPPDVNTDFVDVVIYRRMIYRLFMDLTDPIVIVDDSIKEELKKPTFDNWLFCDAVLLVFLRLMYMELGLVTEFNIRDGVLKEWLFKIYRSYNMVPFHSFKHCFMVTQMMYSLIWMLNLKEQLTPLEIFSLMTTAVCHDIDHKGFNNTYQVNVQTDLAMRYHDISPLENHHCTLTLKILSDPKYEITSNFTHDQFRMFRKIMIRCIMATDLIKHGEVLAAAEKILKDSALNETPVDMTVQEHRHTMLVLLMKTADISNEARPLKVSGEWLNCLLDEYFRQSDSEKAKDIPVTPFMDRNLVTKPSAQIGFIQHMLLPLLYTVAKFYPNIQDPLVTTAENNLEYYKQMQDGTVTEQ